MQLYLIRHGEAVSLGSDMDRPLTSRGIEEIKRIAEILKKRIKVIDTVFYSTRRRARETAFVLAGALNCKSSCKEHSRLGPDDPVQSIADELREIAIERPDATIFIVGHLPFVHKLADGLATSRNALIAAFPTGSVAYLTFSEAGGWIFEEMILP